MAGASTAGSRELEPDDVPTLESRRSLRDLGALLALPALWVDHEPGEIVTGLLSVLFGILQLDSAYARFDNELDERELEAWRPSSPTPPEELQPALASGRSVVTGVATSDVQTASARVFRVTSLTLTLPWAGGIVVVSATRTSFPTATETHLLRVAVSQAAIAIHTAQRLARERDARTAAEERLQHQTELVRMLVEDFEPSLTSLAHRVKDAMREGDVDVRPRSGQRAGGRSARDDPSELAERLHSAHAPLTRRESEVLGLLAQGLSNKEIAGTLWLSERTIERHITSLYRKIGVARRSEATAFALRHGISP